MKYVFLLLCLLTSCSTYRDGDYTIASNSGSIQVSSIKINDPENYVDYIDKNGKKGRIYGSFEISRN